MQWLQKAAERFLKEHSLHRGSLQDAAKKLMDCSVVSRVDADEAANLKKASCEPLLILLLIIVHQPINNQQCVFWLSSFSVFGDTTGQLLVKHCREIMG